MADGDRVVSDVEIAPKIERCQCCGFAWVKGTPAAHAEGCNEVFFDELDTRFTYHPPSEEQIPKFNGLRLEARQMARMITRDCPDSREKSLALTKLEEAVMWANAAIARRS